MATLEGWPVFVWAGALVLAVLAAGVTAAAGGPRRETIPAPHVAGATLIGFFGWQTLTRLPALVTGYWALTAGLGDVDGIEPQQIFVVGQIAFTVTCGLAVFGILRGARWGAVLGIGLAATHAIWSVAVLIQNWSLYGDSYTDGLMLDLTLGALGAQIGPALVAAVLLAWPLLRDEEVMSEAIET